MYFEQFYLGCLSQASYVIGDETTGRAVVVDPRRDVEIYLEAAQARGLTIERIIETHVHADFVSGHLELAARTGAAISYGEAIGETGFPVARLGHGDRLELGDVVIEVRSTPGHTPESIALVVFETRDAVVPYGVLTGDTLLLGGVGRPDLASTDASEVPRSARRLFASIRDEILSLPDLTRVFPAHGAGSACGKNLSTETSSTIGEQRRTNEAIRSSEDEFVESVAHDQPTMPGYFPFDARSNRESRALLDPTSPPELTADQVRALVDDGAVVLDTREPDRFAAGHLPGAINVSLAGRFAEQAGMVLDPGGRVIVAGEPGSALEAKVRLARVGFDAVVGAATRGEASDPWAGETATLRRVMAPELAAQLGDRVDLQLVDVRNPAEAREGGIRGARLIPLAALPSRLTELDPARPVVVYCASGRRSATAASLLAASGFGDVADLVDGFDAWNRSGLPTQ